MRSLSFIVLVLSLTLAVPCLAQSNGNGNGNGTGHGKNATQGSVTQGTTVAVSLITAYERSTILGYAQSHQSFGGGQPLPPGIAKKLARGGSLPPGIAKRYFPNDLIGQLPPR